MTGGFYSIQKNVLDARSLRGLVDGICQSEYLGKSPLGDEFVNTSGFSVVFKREAIDEVTNTFPFLEPYLKAVVFDGINAFYVNPLVLNASSRVSPHIDCRLLSPENIRLIPNLVSVFYAQVSTKMQGGRLVLNVGTGNEVTLKPGTNEVVHFLGKVIHCVTEVKNPSRRISVVCEQYNLEDDVLKVFPYFQVICNEDIAPRVAVDTTSL